MIMYCPVCVGRLVEEPVGGVIIHRCAPCRSLWLEPGTVQRYLQARFPEYRHPLPADHDFADGVPRDSSKPKTTCLNCTGTTLVPGRLRQLPGVEYRRCSTCNGLLINEHLLMRVVRVPDREVPGWLIATLVVLFFPFFIVGQELLFLGLDRGLDALFGKAGWVVFLAILLLFRFTIGRHMERAGAEKR